jgi:hypothetical protein
MKLKGLTELSYLIGKKDFENTNPWLNKEEKRTY